MRNAALMVMVLALTACGGGAESPADTAGTPSAAAPAAGTARGNEAVQAVLQSQGTPVAKLEFVLPVRPVAGTPFALQLHVSASDPLPQLELAAESTGLSIAPASATLAVEAGQEPVVHELILTAPREGLVDLLVRLKNGDAPDTVYAVPVLVAAAATTP